MMPGPNSGVESKGGLLSGQPEAAVKTSGEWDLQQYMVFI